MPGRNQTGPMGQGAMTGRGLGNCNTANNQVSSNGVANNSAPGFGRGQGGMGRGMGYGPGMVRGQGRGLGRGLGRGMGYGAGMAYNSGAVQGQMNIQPMGTPVPLEDNQKKRLESLNNVSNADIAEQLARLNNRIDSLENEIQDFNKG